MVDNLEWLNGGREFLWVSEQDGWRHAYRVPREGGRPVLVTPFNADLIEVLDADWSHQALYFLASPDEATPQYLYRADLDGPVRPGD